MSMKILAWDLTKIDGSETSPTALSVGSVDFFKKKAFAHFGKTEAQVDDPREFTFAGVKLVEDPGLPRNMVVVKDGNEVLNIITI